MISEDHRKLAKTFKYFWKFCEFWKVLPTQAHCSLTKKQYVDDLNQCVLSVLLPSHRSSVNTLLLHV